MNQSIPSFHDGHLTGIALNAKDAVLTLRGSDEVLYVLTLSGLRALQMNDFREGNVVSSVKVMTGHAPETYVREQLMPRLFPPPHPAAAPRYEEEYATFIQARLTDLARGVASLISIESSYGANLAAFCESVEVREATP